MEIVQAVKKLNSISRERLNFRRRPILCTTLYRNPMQASNFGGTFDQLFLRIFLSNFHRRCLSTSSIPWCKKSQKWPKTQIKGGPALSQQKFKAEQSISMGSSVICAIDREARKLCGATGAKRQSLSERKCPSNAGLDSWYNIFFFWGGGLCILTQQPTADFSKKRRVHIFGGVLICCVLRCGPSPLLLVTNQSKRFVTKTCSHAAHKWSINKLVERTSPLILIRDETNPDFIVTEF